MMTNEIELREKIAELSAEVERLKNEQAAVKKNHKPGVANASRKYVLLTKTLSTWGKVPQQQKDIADLLARHMVLGQEYSEQEVFNLMIDQSGDYPSITSSKQDATYLFRYYRGLKNDGKHAGLIARDFMRMI